MKEHHRTLQDIRRKCALKTSRLIGDNEVNILYNRIFELSLQYVEVLSNTRQFFQRKEGLGPPSRI